MAIVGSGPVVCFQTICCRDESFSAMAPASRSVPLETMDAQLVTSYDYELPSELIAQVPLPDRDGSRLMRVDRLTGEISHHSFRELPELLQPRDLLVVNNSRVLPARLYGERVKTGGRWEGLFLHTGPDGFWRCIGKTRGYLQPGETIRVWQRQDPTQEAFRLTLRDREPEGVLVLESSATGSVLESLQRAGEVPLPPYIHRDSPKAADDERYQTTYASRPGSVAAPTAGLHFTPAIFDQLAARGIQRTDVTLHVGLGTFRPVAVERVTEHVMHSEWCEVPAMTAALIHQAKTSGGRVVAVGTTSFRTLESAATFGNPGASLPVGGWEGQTNLFVYPPYRCRVIDALVTNFHLPRSTLLMLVSAIAGIELMREAYRQAVAERYRFFSYGDAMLIV